MSEFFGVDLIQDHAAEAQSGHSVGTRQVRKKRLCLNECMSKSRKCHFLNRSRFSHLKERPLGMVSAGYDGFPPAVPWTYPSGSLRAAISTRRLCCI